MSEAGTETSRTSAAGSGAVGSGTAGSSAASDDRRAAVSEAPAEVRPALASDANGVVAAVSALLIELGATPPDAEAMEQTARSLIEDGEQGIVLLAEADGEIVGVIVSSVQSAIHIPGRYALIQDLWVKPSWRSRAIGKALMDALCEVASERGLARLEVGLPKEGFPRLESTRAFYLGNDFGPLGPRMRRLLR